jgi:hypothetical protein
MACNQLTERETETDWHSIDPAHMFLAPSNSSFVFLGYVFLSFCFFFFFFFEKHINDIFFNIFQPKNKSISSDKISELFQHSHSLSKVRGSISSCVWKTSLGEHFIPLWADPVRAWINLDQHPGHRVVYIKKKI